ncbi:RagB/SusD family nutrient uptake outer membrane protein [uncultured Draconibacterium sp.]|uniref:RagB/SusD family nutrient uptake outer membrane protein n=1 Tax=uncultured Draconibacterium sp. TaxID=1573823 RepID=UPI0032174D00
MKKNIIVFLLSLTGLLSCNVEDDLVIPQHGVLSVEDTYTNADDEEATAFIASVYHKLRGNNWDVFSTYYYSLYGTGYYSVRHRMEQMSGDFSDYFSYSESASAFTYSMLWSYYYSIIYHCSMIVEHLPANNVASAETKERVIAEARAIRSIMMMYLVQLWGNPPLADHILNGSEGNTPASESWDFIETELAAAAELLPSKSGLGGQSEIGGRITREAVYAYLGKAYLWQKKYNEAASVLYSKVISTNLYDLVPDFTALNSYTSDFCDEYLWEIETHFDNNYATSQAGRLEVVYNWSSGIHYPAEIYSGAGYGLTACASKSFGNFMDSHDITAGGAKSTRYRGTIASYEDLLDESIFTYPGEKGVATRVDDGEGYWRMKSIPRTENTYGEAFWHGTFLHNNLCFMRYAEVLLNYAEAVAMGGSEGTLSGLGALNLVRERAGLDDALALDMDNEEYGIKAERRAELYYENSRFIDLVRWGDAASVLASVGKVKPTFFGYVNGQNSVPQSKENWRIEYAQTTGEGFKSGQHELFPIPASDKNSNPNLVQNPNW